MLPIERQKRIKELIKQKNHMKISELSNVLGVSEMTVHRDLKPLIDEGAVIKTFGGVTAAPKTKNNHPNTESCIICSHIINERFSYRLILPNNKTEIACCPHCGLIRHLQLSDEVIQAICYDFLRQTTLSATLAWFVMDTSVHIDCCQPQVLTFEQRDHADKFVKGFGGKVYSFNEAMKSVLAEMNRKMHHQCNQHN